MGVLHILRVQMRGKKVIKNVLMEHIALKIGLKAGSISTRRDREVFHVEEMA